MRVIVIDDDKREDFSGVLPADAVFGRQCILLGAVDNNGRAQGALAVSEDPEQYTIEWLFVDPKARRQKAGTTLIEGLDRMADTVGIKPVRAVFEPDDEGTLFAFFDSFDRPGLSFDTSFSHNRYRILAKDFFDTPRLKKNYQSKVKPKEFFSLSEAQQRSMLGEVSDQYAVSDRKEWERTCEKQLCLAVLSGDDPQAFLIAQRQGGNVIELSFLYSNNPKALYVLLQETAILLKENYNKSTIVFDAVFPKSEVMARQFFENAAVSDIYEAELI